MTLALIGVNHKTAPIALREKIAIGRDDLTVRPRAFDLASDWRSTAAETA